MTTLTTLTPTHPSMASTGGPLSHKHEMDAVDEVILEELIVQLGLKKHHLSPDPNCFICRHGNGHSPGSKMVDLFHTKHCSESAPMVRGGGK